MVRFVPAGVLASLALLASAAPLCAADKASGRQKAMMCQGCHGLDGMGKVPGAPHLAGQDEQYLVKALGDYKSGARKNEQMSVAASQIDPRDIPDLAAYYASLEFRKE